MKKTFISALFTLILCVGFMTTQESVAQDSTLVTPLPKIQYEEWVKLSDVAFEAVARPFSGVLKTPQGDAFFIIGGSKFVEGKKIYSDKVSSLSLIKSDSAQVSARLWEDVVYPFPVSDGLTLATDKGLLCIGGYDQNTQAITSAVYLMTPPTKDSPITFVKMPDFPIPTSMSCGGVIANIAYVYEKNKLYALNLKAKEMKWVELDGIPGDVNRQQPAGCVQQADQKKLALFVVGGMDAQSPANTALNDAWKFEPTIKQGEISGQWTRINDITLNDSPLSTIGAIAYPSGCEVILFFGGFNLEIWNQRCQDNMNMSPEDFKAKYSEWQVDSYQWNRNVMALNTVTNEWISLKNPMPYPTCGAAVGMLEKQMIVAAGEIMPACRTTNIQIGNFELVRSFGTLNWIIFLTYLGLMLPFGFFFMKRGKDTKDYFKGGGRIPWWVNGVSIFATMLSSLTFMTIPAMTFISDWRYFPLAIAIFAMAPIVIYLYLPFFRRLNITSAYEYLELRFNLFCRIFASFAFIIFMIARSAVVTFLPSLALSVVAGIDLFTSIILVGSITVIYSTIGGMEAVVWSDFIQAIVLIGGALVALVMLVMGSGGISEMVTVASEAQKMNILDLSWSIAEPVLWVTIIGGLAANLSSYTSDQTIVQRYLTTKDEKGAARSIWFNGTLSVLSSALFYALGTALYTFYKKNPGAFDIVMASNDSIFPTFIVTELPPGISGLLIAAIFAATMSTLSSNFNSAATAFVTDFYRRFFTDDEKKAFHMAHVTTAVVGTLAIVFAIVIASWQNIFSLFDTFQTMIGILTGGLAGLFFMGIFMSRINGIGAIAGLAASYIVNIIFKFTDIVPHKPHLLLYSAIGLVACVVVGYIVSILTYKPTAKHVEGLTLKYPKAKEPPDA